MLKKTITYKDYDGNEVTEDFYFHLNEAELMELELSYGEKGLSEHLEAIVKSKDNMAILNSFKQIIKKAHGAKSEDGKRFIKNEETLSQFMDTQAYSALFMEIGFDADKAVEFVNGIMPVNLDKE